MICRYWFNLFTCIFSVLLIVVCEQDQGPMPLDGRKNRAHPSKRIEKAVEKADSNEILQPPPVGTPSSSQRGEVSQKTYDEHEHDHTAHFDLPSSHARITKEQWERIDALYQSLTEEDWEGIDRLGPHPKKFEILTEGMDAFIAAKYLDSLGENLNYVLKYAKQAVAENPGDFDVLLFYAKSLVDNDDEVEVTYRQLYEIGPDSIEVLYGLGRILSFRKPDEAIGYLQKVVAMNPDHALAYLNLGLSYRTLGQWDEAITAYQKSEELFDLDSKWLPQGAIRLTNQMKKEAGARESLDIGTEDMPPEVSSPSTSTTQTAAVPNHVESTPDEPKGESTPPRQDTGPTVAQKQAFNQFMRQLEAYERTAIRDPEGFGRRFDNLIQAIKKNPNRSDNLLKLGRAYEDIGDLNKADEVYKQARNRFPSDRQVRNAREAFRERLKRARERGESSPSSRDNQDAPKQRK